MNFAVDEEATGENFCVDFCKDRCHGGVLVEICHGAEVFLEKMVFREGLGSDGRGEGLRDEDGVEPSDKVIGLDGAPKVGLVSVVFASHGRGCIECCDGREHTECRF